MKLESIIFGKAPRMIFIIISENRGEQFQTKKTVKHRPRKSCQTIEQLRVKKSSQSIKMCFDQKG